MPTVDEQTLNSMLASSQSLGGRPHLARTRSRATSVKTCALFGFGSKAKTAPAQAPATQATPDRPVPFPSDYDQAIRQSQQAVQAAIADGHRLIEVEFPATSLTSVQGDGEGMNEMNASMGFIRQFLSAFRDQAEGVRIFWPDNKELAVAKQGQTMDPAAGRAQMDAKFADTSFKMGYLTRQNAVWATLGVNVGMGQKFSPVQQVKDTDTLFVVAYPHFNPREELSAVNELVNGAAAPRDIPVVVFNGELDRVRGGYYPSLFFSELAKITAELVPRFTQAYYIHNFKGTRPGVLFRAYPGPWCVYRRNPVDNSDLRLIYTSDKMPSLKEVSLEILPSNRPEIRI